MLSFWLSSQLLYTAGSKPTVGDEGKLSHYSCRVITIVVEFSAVSLEEMQHFVFDLGFDQMIEKKTSFLCNSCRVKTVVITWLYI